MRRPESLIHNCWPLWERPLHFELGAMLECQAVEFGRADQISRRAGWWECELPENRLTWSAGVYDIFGLPRQDSIAREEALRFYAEPSRARLERLRADAIGKCCGFTIDVELRPASGEPRWMRIIGAPDIADEKVVRLHGLKLWL